MTYNLINPYNLLGVTINSSIKDIRKSYYKLSLICHPDKGGNKDDMNIIHNAYLYVINQIEFSEEKDTLENIENNFKNFYNINKSDLPPFYEIWKKSEEGEFLKEFNKQFEENKNVSNIFNDGYGKYMEEDEDKTKYITKSLINFSDKNVINEYRNINKDIALKNNFTEELVIYSEPTSINDEIYGSYERYDIDKLNDYSHNAGSLNMCDYKIAYTNKK